MAIEIRELLIRVKIEEPMDQKNLEVEVDQIKQSILKECRNTIKKELRKSKER